MYSYVWHEVCATTRVACLMRGLDVYVWHDSFRCVMWLLQMCDVWPDVFICVTWLVWLKGFMRMCDVTHSDVWCGFWRCAMCDVMYWYVWHDLFARVACLISRFHTYVWHVCDIWHTNSYGHTNSFVWYLSWRIHMNMTFDIRILRVPSDTGWRRPIGSLKLQAIFRKRATHYRALSRKMTYEDKASYASTPPCIRIHMGKRIHLGSRMAIWIRMSNITHMNSYSWHLLYEFIRAYEFPHEFIGQMSHTWIRICDMFYTNSYGDVPVCEFWHDMHIHSHDSCTCISSCSERWGAGVETQKNVRGEIGGWDRVPFNEPYAPSLSTIYDGA